MPTRTRTLQAQAPSWLAALLTEHEKTWIGPVAMATYKASRRYVGGFLGTCEVKPQMSAATRRAATDHPAWSTVKTLRVHGGVSDSHALTFPLQACMRGLRRLEGAFPSDFIVLATRKPPLAIDHLVLDFQYTNELDLIAAEHAAVGTAPGLPCLHPPPCRRQRGA